MAAPRSKLYLADGYDMVRYYTEHMNIEEKKGKKGTGYPDFICYARYEKITSFRGSGL